MEEIEEIKEALEEVIEAHEEEGQNIENDSNLDQNSLLDEEQANEEVEDAHENEGAKIEALEKELAELKSQLEKVTKERDQANDMFLNGGKESKEEKRDYDSILGDIK